MRSCGRLRKGLLIMALLLCMTVQTAFAAEGGNEKEYTYTVTLFAGNQGTFNGTGGVHVIGGSAQISGGDAIRITGLRAGDVVVLDATAGMVDLKNGDKYYIKGVRESGRDNNTVADSAFTVTKDAEYVVAYGIQGDMVSYTVNYQDGGGNELAPSRTYYGAVGDKPVIAYQYIEGYRPDAYNLTKTLGKNEADNVFTFTYTQSSVQQPAAGGEGTEGGTDAGAPERRLRLVQRQAAQGRQGPVQRLLRARLKRRRQRIRMKRYRRGRLIWMTKIRRRPILMLRILIL